MANSAFGSPFWSDANGTFTPTFAGGSWLSALPLANLADRRLAKVARSTTAAAKDTRFSTHLGRPCRVGIVALPHHNLSSAAVVRVIVSYTNQFSFAYEAGQDIADIGGTFTRASTATYIDREGIVRTAASGVLRDAHFTAVNGRRTTLIEPSRTNLLLRSQEFDNAAWSKTNVTVTANAAVAPDATTTADKVAATATASTMLTQSVVVAATAATLTVFVKQGSGATNANGFGLYNTTTAADLLFIDFNYTTGAITYISGVAGASALPLGNGWWRLTLRVSAGITSGDTVTSYVAFRSGSYTAGTYAYVWGADLAPASWATTYNPTTTAAVTRAADALTFASGLTTPEALTFYTKFYEQYDHVAGSAYYTGLSAGLVNPAFVFASNASVTIARFTSSAPADFDSNVGGTLPTIGDSVELAAQLAVSGANGTITQLRAVNDGAISTGAASGSFALPAAWGGSTITFAIAGVESGAAFESFRIMPGVQTMAAMRAASYDSGWIAIWPAVYPPGILPSNDPRVASLGYSAEERAVTDIGFTHVLTTPTLANRIDVQILDASNAAGYVDLGRLVVADSIQPTINLAYGAALGLSTATTREETDGGAAVYDVRPVRREQVFTIDNLPQDEALAQFFDMFRRRGTSGQLYFVFDPDDTYHLHRRSYLCVMRELPKLAYPWGTATTMAFSLIEEL